MCRAVISRPVILRAGHYSNSAPCFRPSGALTLRNASTAKPNKAIGLEKPDKFRPPSHPARLPRKKANFEYGPRLTEDQKARMRTKQYPNMLPPEGTFMHMILTTRWIHAYTTLVCYSYSTMYTMKLSRFAWRISGL
jgi:hypothetical protein